MKPDLYLGTEKIPYYFEYSRISYTLSKYANLGDCWEVYSPSEKDLKLVEEGVIEIEKTNYPYKNFNMSLVYDILDSLRKDKCFNACFENPCEEQCVHCKCLNCYLCDIRYYWKDKC